MSKYEVVIGIETHVQLATKTKLFCGCNNDSREAKPNTHVCPVCIALPGALPVLNGAAIGLALQAGLALNGEIPKHTKFDRKNYFYPDSPSGYQITQFDEPIVGKGYVEFPLDGKPVKIGVTRAHLEADAGKLTHPAAADYSLVDLNRAGTPLMEIVSEPDIRSAAEAKAYAQELYNLMRYAAVSDANLYYGNMRFDVNVSLRPLGQKEFGTRTETKNLNSFRAVYNAAQYEIERQTELLEKGEKIIQETRGWDDDKGATFSQRSKEEAHDYRYFPEPDLPPIEVTESMLKNTKAAMPDYMPMTLRSHLRDAGITGSDAEVLIEDKAAANMWVAVSKIHPTDMRPGKFAFNWLIGDRIKVAEDKNQSLSDSNITAETLSAVAEMVQEGQLSSTNAKRVLSELWVMKGDPQSVAENQGLFQNSDKGALEKIIDQVITDNLEPVEQYKAGETKVMGFLVGQVMKASKGQANPPMVNEILKRKLG